LRRLLQKSTFILESGISAESLRLNTAYMLANLISGIAYGMAAAAIPGPLSLYLISEAVRHGWRRTLPAVFAPLISDGPIAVLVILVLVQIPAALVRYLQILGGAFLLYLALGAWRSWRDFDEKSSIAVESSPNRLLKAATVNWLNPNPYLGWSTYLGPAAIYGWRSSPASGIALLIGFYAAIIATMVGIIILFSAAGKIGPRVNRGLIGLSSIVLACLGLYQLRLGLFILLQ
jgi:threonine/homoserine/homoserine lactone efflux protein